MLKGMEGWPSSSGIVERHGIKAGDFKKIKAVIDENADIIIAQWNKHFNQ